MCIRRKDPLCFQCISLGIVDTSPECIEPELTVSGGSFSSSPSLDARSVSWAGFSNFRLGMTSKNAFSQSLYSSLSRPSQNMRLEWRLHIPLGHDIETLVDRQNLARCHVNVFANWQCCMPDLEILRDIVAEILRRLCSALTGVSLETNILYTYCGQRCRL